MRRIDEHSDQPICWLNGPAGYGKSAIAQAIAERYAAQGRLGASFFFLRGAGDRSTISRVIPTISHQLSITVPATKSLIQRIIENEPHIMSQSLEYQFQKLVTEPMKSVGGSTSLQTAINPVTVIIVIDALDECNDKDQMAAFIEMVICAFTTNPRLSLQILITSRVEEHISQKLETSRSSVQLCTACLFKISMLEMTFSYSSGLPLKPSTKRIPGSCKTYVCNHGLPESDLGTLVEKSDGSFIFAATLVDFIQKGSGLPQDKLQKALTAEEGLDALYTFCWMLHVTNILIMSLALSCLFPPLYPSHLLHTCFSSNQKILCNPCW